MEIIPEDLEKTAFFNGFLGKLNKHGILYISNDDVHFTNILQKKIDVANARRSKNQRLSLSDKKAFYKKLENDFACKDFDEVREFVKVKDFFAQKGIHSGSCSRVRDLIYSWLKSKSSKFVRIEKTVIYDSSKVDVKFISSMAQFSKIVKELKIERDCMFFRGQSILNREEKTSLVRSNPEYEVQFYDEIINLYPEEFCNENTYFDKLSEKLSNVVDEKLNIC